MQTKKYAILCPDFQGKPKFDPRLNLPADSFTIDDPLELLKQDQENGKECQAAYGDISDSSIFTTQGPNLTATWVDTALKIGRIIGALLMVITIVYFWLLFDSWSTLVPKLMTVAGIAGVALTLITSALLLNRKPILAEKRS